MSRSQYNSSKTRVCPAFRVIKENPEPFFNLLHDKLDKLWIKPGVF